MEIWPLPWNTKKIMFLTRRRYHVILWMHWTLASGSASSICYHLKFENSIKLPSTWWPFFMEEMHIYNLYLSKSKTLSGLQTPHNLSEWFHQSWLVSGGITLYHFFFIPSTKFETLKFGLRREMHIKTCKKMFSTKKYHVILLKMHWNLAQGKCKFNEDNQDLKNPIKLPCPWWPFSLWYH